MAELISKKTRYEFQEQMVSWTLREIETEFHFQDLEADLEHEPNVSGQRRTLVAQYYQNIDFSNWASVSKLLKIYETILGNLTNSIENPSPHFPDVSALSRRLQILLNCLKGDHFTYIDGRIISVQSVGTIDHAQSVGILLNADFMKRQYDRMNEALKNDDPDLAIGSAKEFVESVSKAIITERGVKLNSKKPDLRELVKTCLKELGLVPSAISNQAKGQETIKRLLNNLGTIVDSIDELRNQYGTGHGKPLNYKGLQKRHAKLVISAATGLAVFMFDTHQEKPVVQEEIVT